MAGGSAVPGAPPSAPGDGHRTGKEVVKKMLVTVWKAVIQVCIWIGWLCMSCLGILWIGFNMWLCSVVTDKIYDLGVAKDKAFLIGITFAMIHYAFTPILIFFILFQICQFFENLETKNRCIIWWCQDHLQEDEPAEKMTRGGPPAYAECVEGGEGLPDYNTAVAGIV
jgi:hypothetical protein